MDVALVFLATTNSGLVFNTVTSICQTQFASQNLIAITLLGQFSCCYLAVYSIPFNMSLILFAIPLRMLCEMNISNIATSGDHQGPSITLQIASNSELLPVRQISFLLTISTSTDDTTQMSWGFYKGLMERLFWFFFWFLQRFIFKTMKGCK